MVPGAFAPIQVTWQDAAACDQAWAAPEELDCELHPVLSVGLFVKMTDDALVIAQCYDRTTGNVHGAGLIPLACIVSMEAL